MIRAVLRAQRRAGDRATGSGDSGVSLVEVLVAIFVSGILLTGVATVFSGTLRGVRTVNVKTATSADARTAMEAMSRTLRVAFVPPGQSSAISLAQTNALTFYSLINRTGANATASIIATKIEYAWDGTCLNEAQTPGVNAASPTWTTGRTVKCLARTSVPPEFSYFASGSDATAIPIPSGGLALTDRQAVQSVQVALTVTDANNPTINGTPVVDRMTLINVQILAGG